MNVLVQKWTTPDGEIWCLGLKQAALDAITERMVGVNDGSSKLDGVFRGSVPDTHDICGYLVNGPVLLFASEMEEVQFKYI
jgi:hypothetical protein